MEKAINVTIWNEGLPETINEEVRRFWPDDVRKKAFDEVRRLYLDGINGALASSLQALPGLRVRTATMDEPDHGLGGTVLDTTDVLIWWGHMAHDQVRDDIVDRVQARVLAGMGLICLHSTHLSKIFRRLMGTTCSLRWRVAGEKERVWVVAPGHPIAAGLPPYFEIPRAEMYGEPFDIPQPDAVVFISWFSGGEVFRSGCCFQRGNGKVFYFAPGHETYPIFHQAEVLKVIANAVHWAAPTCNVGISQQHVPTPLEPLR